MVSQQISVTIFCQVVDNYGDIGVCWRLARQLALPPFNCNVSLWVDDLNTFKYLEPNINTNLPAQTCQQVQVINWHAHTAVSNYNNPDIVIEAFACTLPSNILALMAHSKPLWLNLEYLSAEAWVESAHLMPSPQPYGLQKHFYFPGFNDNTGGLLRETNLIEQRNTWQASPNNKYRLLEQLAVGSHHINAIKNGALLLLLFCYPNAPVNSLVSALKAAKQEAVILVPEGVFDRLPPDTIRHATTTNLVHLQVIPFIRQEQFDHLLWSTDLNIVRGEDSLIRAIWAGKPMIWQPYIQDDNAHITKLQAFLQQSRLSHKYEQLIISWSDHNLNTFSKLLATHIQTASFSQWQQQAKKWSDQLHQQTDLATRLIDFYTKSTRYKLK